MFNFLIFSYDDDTVVCWKTEVSENELQRTKELIRGLSDVISQNFWARNPPSDAPNTWTL